MSRESELLVLLHRPRLDNVCYIKCNIRYVPPLTSEAHSCRVPTTGISMFSCGDLSRRPNQGIPPALRMASLFLVLLLQLHSARAPQRATSSSFSWVAVRLAKLGTQSSSFTWAGRQGTQTYMGTNTNMKMCANKQADHTCLSRKLPHTFAQTQWTWHTFKDSEKFACGIGVIMDGSRWE